MLTNQDKDELRQLGTHVATLSHFIAQTFTLEQIAQLEAQNEREDRMRDTTAFLLDPTYARANHTRLVHASSVLRTFCAFARTVLEAIEAASNESNNDAT